MQAVRKNQQGFTFTELLVALVINALLLSAMVAIFIANINHYNRVINFNRLNDQLNAAMQFMTNEIRRAGYWGNVSADVGTHQNNNPFVASGVDVSINVGQNCILFSYDKDDNGALPTISNSVDDERYGFRLDGQTLQARPRGASFDCSAPSSSWENVTDLNYVQITALTFTLNSHTITTGPATKGITFRSVDITLTGRLTSDNSITRTLTQHVGIRNDKFIP
jgi:prepilin peptidase dependent protein B